MARTYRHRIALQEPVQLQDATTGEVYTFWRTVSNCAAIPCDLLTGPGREFKGSGTTQAEVSLRVAFRWFEGLLPTWRLVWNGRTYNIASIELDTSARREYRLTCTGLGELLPALATPVSAAIDVAGTSCVWTFAAPVGGSATLGWSLSAPTISAGTVSGNTITQTISQVLQGATVTGSYSATTGTLVGYGGAVASFAGFAITNGSTVGVGYPLNDDGTVASLFGYSPLPASPPGYTQVTRTLTGSGGFCAACPSADTAFTTQFIPYSQGGKIYAEMLVSAAPAAVVGENDMYAGVEFFAHGDSNSSSGSFAVVYPSPDGNWLNGKGDLIAVSGYRIGVIYDLDTGDIETWDSSGLLQHVSYGKPPNTEGVFAALTMRDDFAGFAGGQFTFSLIGNAADMQIPYIAAGFPAGVKDLAGVHI